MPNPDPIQVLMDEHQIILRVLSAFEAKTSTLGQGEFPRQFIEDCLDFFKNFADGCHHYKEEDALFPAMVNNGMPREAGPIAVMLQDHDYGRRCLGLVREHSAAAAAGNAEAVETVRRAAQAYVEMLRAHIAKEDNILFQMARRVLPESDIAALAADFQNEANPKIASPVRRKYEALAAELAAASAPA